MAGSAAFDVLVVGSLNLDLVARCERLPAPGETVHGDDYAEYPGGKGLNQAVAAARAGAQVSLVGAVGDDAAGERLRGVVRDEGIGDDQLLTVEGVPTGRALIAVDGNAENAIVVVPGANGRVDVAGLDLPTATVVLAQLEVPVAAVVDGFVRTAAAGSTTVLNPAPATALPDDLLAACSIVVPNEHEVELSGGVDRLLDVGVRDVVVTRGAAGVQHVTSAGARDQPAFDIEPVDTTGAGDAFCGALAAELARGVPVAESIRFASAAGALATTMAGAVPSLPRRADIDALLAR